MTTPGFREAESDESLALAAGIAATLAEDDLPRHASYHIHIRDTHISKKTRALLTQLDKPRATIRRHGRLWRVMVDPTIQEDHGGKRGVTSLDYTLVEIKNRRW